MINIPKYQRVMRASAVTLVLLLACALAFGQTGVATTPNSSNAQTTTAGVSGGSTSGSAMAASNDLRILSPKVDQKIGASDISVRYELTNASADAAPSPTYRVQLDGRDPAETLDTSYNFTGLAPGPHTFVVELVDANHTPIIGSEAVVHFTTFVPGANTAPASGTNGSGTQGTTGSPKPHTTGSLLPPPVVKASLPLASNRAAEELPSAGGELPLLSMVGFGVLVGGVISAMRTRK